MVRLAAGLRALRGGRALAGAVPVGTLASRIRADLRRRRLVAGNPLMTAPLAAGDLGLLESEPMPEPESASKGVTFGEYVRQFLAKTEPQAADPTHGLKRSTWNDYRHCFKERLEALWGERVLAEICRRDVKDLASQLQQQGLSTVNVRKHLRIVSSIVSEAVDDELLQANPAAALRKRGECRSNSGTTARPSPCPSTPIFSRATTSDSSICWVPVVHPGAPDTGYTVPAKTVPLKKSGVILRKARPG
ncbi:MAG: hypothetical protein H6Q33_382 [Deltaproteobacteria bacterium]|nr:hypothetical protein [Deltaproteobacteria bacterium]